MPYYFSFILDFWMHCIARRILAPPPGTKGAQPAVKVQSLNPWTAREIPQDPLLKGGAWPPGALIERFTPFCSSCAFNLMKYDHFCSICTTFHCQHSSDAWMEMTKWKTFKMERL